MLTRPKAEHTTPASGSRFVPHRLRALLVDTESDESLIAGFLLGYGDRTRAAYLADLRDFHAWCARIGIGLLAAHRGHIEAYIRALEQAGRSRGAGGLVGRARGKLRALADEDRGA